MNNIFLPIIDKNNTILFVGIGNRLKSDDTIGIYICEELKQSGRKQVLIVESGIEKFVGKINMMNPDILVFVDCTDFNKEPGYFKLFPISETIDNTLHTHTISLLRISEFFKMQTYVLGIQPKFVGFGEEISPEVIKSANKIVTFLNKLT